LAILGAAIAFDLYLERARAEEIEKDRLVTQARVIAANMEHQLQSATLVLKNVRDELPAWKRSSELRATTSHSRRSSMRCRHTLYRGGR